MWKKKKVEIAKETIYEKEYNALLDLIRRFVNVTKIDLTDSIVPYYYVTAEERFRKRVQELEERAATEIEYQKVKKLVDRALEENGHATIPDATGHSGNYQKFEYGDAFKPTEK